jgi:hypothetical protein
MIHWDCCRQWQRKGENMSKFEAVPNNAGGFKVTITNPEPPWTKEDGKRVGEYFYKGPQIIINSGITINLQNLEQNLTYAAVLQGIPWGPYYKGFVDSQVRWFKEERKRNGIENSAYVVIEPEVLSLPVSKEVCASMQSFYDVESVSIAPVACRGRFEYHKPVREEKQDGSELTIIWFQNEFMAPMPDYVIARIKQIDWEAVADNFLL